MKELTKYLNINKDKVYLKLSLVFFVVWLLFKGPIRNLVITDNPEIQVFLGFAPNLFAGLTLVFWQTYLTSSKPILTLFCVNAVLFFAEFMQFFIETQTPDVLDLVASIVGSTAAMLVVLSIEKNKRSKK